MNIIIYFDIETFYFIFKLISNNRSSLNQLTTFQNNTRTPSHHYLQSTITNTTSGLGSNYTSYTTDPIHSSLSSLVSDVNSKHPKSKFILEPSNTFVEDDVTETNDVNDMYVPEMDNRNYVSPMKAQNYDFYNGKLSWHVDYLVLN